METGAATREDLEHHDAVIATRDVLQTVSGQKLFKFIFKYFAVAEMPELGLDGAFLHDKLGLHRAGAALFELACAANPSVAGSILAAKEKERYEAAVLAELEKRKIGG